MKTQERTLLKLKIINEFKGKHFTLVEVFEIFDDLKNAVSELAVQQELQRLKFKKEKI